MNRIRAMELPRRNRKGVTLVEVMISFAVMTTALFALIQLSFQSNVTQNFTNEINLIRGAVLQKVNEINSRAEGLYETSTDFATDFNNYLNTQLYFGIKGLPGQSGSGDAQGQVVFYKNTAMTDNQHPIFSIEIIATWKGVKGVQTYTYRFTVTR